MTNVDVLYRYGAQPREAAVVSLARLREVYGIRAVRLDEAEKTVRVEYDATRLTEPTVQQFVRRAGIDIVEQMPLTPALEVVETSAPTA